MRSAQNNWSNIEISYALAVAFKLSLLNSSKKSRDKAKDLFKQAPEWWHNSFRLQMPFESIMTFCGIAIKEFSDLQAFWTLKDFFDHSVRGWDSEYLTAHVLRYFGTGDWRVMLGAGEAIVNRIHNAREFLKIASKPASNTIDGIYSVKHADSGKRPYLTTIQRGVYPFGSCTCPDFIKNSLGICKHIAVIHEYWLRKKTKPANLVLGLSPIKNTIYWHPCVNNNTECDSLTRIFVITNNDIKHLCSDIPSHSNPKSRLDFVTAKLKKSKTLTKTHEVDPVVFTILENERSKLLPRVRIANLKNFPDRQLAELKKKLYPYQQDGVRKALVQGSFLLGDDMGLGKTFQAIAWAESLLKSRLVKKVLVISPAALKFQWRREWGQMSDREVSIIEGSATDRQALYKAKFSVSIVNYEAVLKDIDLIIKANYDAIILDEAQRIKNYATKTARVIKQLKTPYRLVLTGTPMENRIQDLASIMDFVDSDALAPSWRLDHETQLSNLQSSSPQKGIRGLNYVRECIAPYFLRRTRHEVLSQLPSRTDSVIDVEATDEQLEVHNAIAADVAKIAAIAQRRPLTPKEHLQLQTLLMQMRIVSNGLAQYSFTSMWPNLKDVTNPESFLAQTFSPKLGHFRNLIEGLLSQENLKIVVFSQWRRMLQLNHWAISDLLKKYNCESVFFTGTISSKERTNNIIRFHDNPDVRIFFATDAGGVGLNLQKAAQVCINLELPWNPAVLEQRNARIYRLGQNKPVQIYNLVTQNTIEARIANLVGNKKAVFDALFSGTSDEIEFSDGKSFINDLGIVAKEFSHNITDDDDLGVLDHTLSPHSCDEAIFEFELNNNLSLDISNEAKAAITETSHSTKTLDQEPEIVNHVNPNQFANHSLSLATAFANITIEKTETGVRIAADKKSAETLFQVFSNMAQMFAQASQ